MRSVDKLIKAFNDLEKKYPEAAEELAKEFTAAIGVAKAKAELAKPDIYTIAVQGKGADGKTYVAEFDAVFPKGTKILNVKQMASE